jgi:hypothetical protein
MLKAYFNFLKGGLFFLLTISGFWILYQRPMFFAWVGVATIVMAALGWICGKLYKKHGMPKISLGGWFSSSKKKGQFELESSIRKGTSIIAAGVEFDIKKDCNGRKMWFYTFECSVKPNMAIMPSGSVECMKVPDEYKIRSFTVGTKPKTNEVQWVSLDDQYHANKHRASSCLFIDDLVQMELSESWLQEMLETMMTYNENDPMCVDHWNNSKFEELNPDLCKALEAA